jgi:hypothetical protein
LKPLRLFLKVDPISAGVKDANKKMQEITRACLENGFDGLVVECQGEMCKKEDLTNLIKSIREVDRNRDLQVMANGILS